MNEPYELDQRSARQDFVQLAREAAQGNSPPGARTIKALAEAAGGISNPTKAFKATVAFLKENQQDGT